MRKFAASSIVDRHIIFGDCYILDKDSYFDLKEQVADHFEIHPPQVVMVGSGKLGFSIAHPKRYRCGPPEGQKSSSRSFGRLTPRRSRNAWSRYSANSSSARGERHSTGPIPMDLFNTSGCRFTRYWIQRRLPFAPCGCGNRLTSTSVAYPPSRQGLNSNKTLSGGRISHLRKISLSRAREMAFSSLFVDLVVQPRIHWRCLQNGCK